MRIRAQSRQSSKLSLFSPARLALGPVAAARRRLPDMPNGAKIHTSPTEHGDRINEYDSSNLPQEFERVDT